MSKKSSKDILLKNQKFYMHRFLEKKEAAPSGELPSQKLFRFFAASHKVLQNSSLLLRLEFHVWYEFHLLLPSKTMLDKYIQMIVPHHQSKTVFLAPTNNAALDRQKLLLFEKNFWGDSLIHNSFATAAL